MSSRAKKLLQLAMTRTESDDDQFSGGGCVVEFVPETKLKLNTVRKENPTFNVVEGQEGHQTEPDKKMSGQEMFFCIESDQLLQSIVMDEENNLNLPNIGLQNNDTTYKITEKRSIEQEEITNKRFKATSTVFLEYAEPMLVGELNHEPDQPAVVMERNNSLDNLDQHDSDLTDCEDLGGELDQEPDQSVLEVDRNDRLDSDLTDCEDLGCELDQEVDIPVVDAETNNELNNVGPHDSDLIEGGDLKTNDKRSRKKKRQPEKWQKNVKKSLKNSGESYQTVKGNTIPAKKLKPPCSTDCRLKCTEKINEEKRLNIFNDFWGIGDLGRQRYFVASCMGVVKPKYSLHREDSKRSLNVSYKFTINSEEIRVCKRFFMATLDIGHSFLSTVNKKKASGIIPEDRRGRHGNTGRCLPQADKDGAREHINSYPRKESHYCRASSTKEYLDGDLNLTMMYRQYKEWCHQNSKPIIKQGTYEHIFRNEFNIAFHKPKKDQCSICLSYQNAVGDDKLQLKYTYEKHLKERDLCRLEKKSDIETCKNDANKIICCYDMQAVLQTPCGNDSLFFYKRRLNVYNCTVFNVVSKAAYCYLWNESLGGKGCDEVGTCIYKFLKDHCVGINVFFYTDNCSAQNKNKYLLSLYHYAIKVLGVVSITHKYLVIGHTQNEGDSVHSTIEREKTRILKNGSIFVPTQWKSVIQCAKKCGTPYEVHELDFSDILDLKDLVTQFGKNFTVNNDGDRVVWNEIKKIYMQASSPYLVFYNDTYEPNSTMKCLNVRNRTRGRSAANVELHLRNKYHQRPKISNLKKKDLLALCDSNVIPRVYREYYSSLEAGDNHIEPDEHNEND